MSSVPEASTDSKYMTAIITLPGIGGSGEAHWQTMWEAQNPDIVRFQPASWDNPELDDWSAALSRTVRTTPEPPLLVAHSLACLLVAHWATRSSGQRVSGAFLVAVPDPEGPAFPAVEAASFKEVPEAPFPFPSLIIASSNDRYGTLDYARKRASTWGAGFVVAGALGHINGAGGLGDWPQGAMLLEAFRAGTLQAA